MGGYAGQNIAKAKDDDLLLVARFWSSFRIAGASHAAES
jgi:hypothetical protein